MNRCRLTRTCVASEDNPAQGRPLGLMAAWLLWEHVEFEPADREEHGNIFSVLSLSAQSRRTARDKLKTMEFADSLFKHERERRLGEPEEPDGFA